MTQLLEEREIHIPADAWASLAPMAPPAPLDDMVAQFLAQGGQIHQVAPGVTAAPLTDFTRTATSPSARYTPEQQMAHVIVKAEKRQRAMRAGDPEAVALIDRMLPTATSARAIADALFCTESKLHRLLREYFAEDPRANRFRHKDRETQMADYERELVAKIKQAVADGIKGMTPIANHCGTSFTRVVDVNRKYRLGIPKGVGGFRKKVGEATA